MSGEDGSKPGDSEGAGLTRSELQHHAIRGSMWTAVHTAVSLPVAFLVNIAVARVLGVLDFGRLAYLSTVIQVVGGLVGVGIGTGLVQFGSKAHAAGRPDEVRRLLAATQGFRLAVVAPVLALAVLTLAKVDLPLMVVAIVFGVALPTALAGAPAALSIENKSATAAKIGMATSLLSQVATVAALYAARSADVVWVARIIATGAGVALALAFVAPGYRRAVVWPQPPTRLPREFWRFSVAAGIAGLIGTLVVSRTEVVVLTWMSQQSAAGIFALAFGLAGHLFAPAQSVVGPLIPAISALQAVDESALRRAFERTLRVSSTVVGGLVAAGLPALALLAPVIYGQEYAEVTAVILPLGIAGGLLFASGPIQAFVRARLQGTRLLVINLIALAVDVVLAVTLIPPLGVWGATIANVAASLTQLALLLVGELRALSLPVRAALRDSAPLFLGGAGAVAAWLVAGASGLAPIAAAVVAGVLGLAWMAAALRVSRTGLSADDVGAIVRSLPGRLTRVGRVVLGLLAYR